MAYGGEADGGALGAVHPDDLLAPRPDADQRDRDADKVLDEAQKSRAATGSSASERHSEMSSLKPGISVYSPVAWCSTVW